MRLPLRMPARHVGRNLAAAIVVALVAAAVLLGAAAAPGVGVAVRMANHVLYDAAYRLRPAEDRTAGRVVIVAVDQRSLDAVDDAYHFGWPWPRDLWARTVAHLSACGARAVVFDLLFTETSVYNNEMNDDQAFGDAVAASKTPVVFAALVGKTGETGRFAPKVLGPVFGAANIGSDDVYRAYTPVVSARASLARQALFSAGVSAGAGDGQSQWRDPFLLHYYGPHQDARGRRTFRYVSAVSVLQASQGGEALTNSGLSPDAFRDKIVLIGATTAGTYDLKASPLSAQYPGVEVQATAIENMLAGDRVREVGTAGTTAASLAAALAASLGVIVPRKAWLKLSAASLAATALLAAAAGLFVGRHITWLPLATPLGAVGLAVVGGFAWSYLTEDRQRRAIFRALSQAVSPAVAEQFQRDPAALALGGARRDMTVMFTDIAGFTDLSESMPADRLGELMIYYLGQMSQIVIDEGAYLDKYIGDAIMSFWNGVVTQPDHAARACRAALGMQRREREIAPELAGYGAARVLTRIGINTGAMVVGNMGSPHKWNYTVLGDRVNFASRLEGANKFYGTQILAGADAARAAGDAFVFRELDLLRVKGKTQPVTIFELMCESPAAGAAGPGAAGAVAQLVSGYASALALYRGQRWGDARRMLVGLARDFPDDGPTATLMGRVAHFEAHPPPPDWDAVYEATSK